MFGDQKGQIGLESGESGQVGGCAKMSLLPLVNVSLIGYSKNYCWCEWEKPRSRVACFI
jgi:hypothetical protein